MQLSVRTATTADAAVIAQFNAMMARETEGRTLDAGLLRRGVEALLADPSKGTYFVAENDGQVVGQTLITYEWSDWRNGNFWWIQSVYVDPGSRGKGVFRALFGHIKELARNQAGVCGLRLYVERNNARAKRTYESLGMKPTHYDLYEIDFVMEPG